MSDKRYLGNIITQNPTAPADNFETTSAAGVWSLAEAFAYTKAGLWPTAGNAAPKALFMGGEHSGGTRVDTVDSVNVTTLGNATDFGDLLGIGSFGAGVSSSTRGIMYGGGQNGTNVIQYFTIATAGNATDFGDATQATNENAGISNETRGISACEGTSNQIEYITIASTGNAATFGNDLTLYRNQVAGASSTTRGLIAGGIGQGVRRNHIGYIEIATTGNATDFGDLTQGRQGLGGMSTNTRGVFYAGYTGSYVNTIDYVTIASTGNATDFGNATQVYANYGCTAGSTRGVAAGASKASSGESPLNTNIIEYITIPTTGNAADFGDLTVSRTRIAACSNSHGGLAA